MKVLAILILVLATLIPHPLIAAEPVESVEPEPRYAPLPSLQFPPLLVPRYGTIAPRAAIAVPVDPEDPAPVSVVTYGNQTHVIQGSKIRTCFTLANGTVQCP